MDQESLPEGITVEMIEELINEIDAEKEKNKQLVEKNRKQEKRMH